MRPSRKIKAANQRLAKLPNSKVTKTESINRFMSHWSSLISRLQYFIVPSFKTKNDMWLKNSIARPVYDTILKKKIQPNAIAIIGKFNWIASFRTIMIENNNFMDQFYHISGK